MDWQDIEFFRSLEFDSPDSIGSGVKMDLTFVKKLDDLRKRCDFPFTIHSGFRTAAHNAQVGGVGDSAHEKGLAADIAIADGRQRYIFVVQALAIGFDRIGIGKTFVHLDIDGTLAPQVIWDYYP
jgi:zinc D-Ala-D-Ala carboxypeptidase